MERQDEHSNIARVEHSQVKIYTVEDLQDENLVVTLCSNDDPEMPAVACPYERRFVHNPGTRTYTVGVRTRLGPAGRAGSPRRIQVALHGFRQDHLMAPRRRDDPIENEPKPDRIIGVGVTRRPSGA